MTASPWASYVNSSLGSRLSETSGGQTTAYRWDAVQRMAYRGPAPGGALTGHAYTYRADGMRVRKQNQAGLAANGALVFHTAGNKVTRTYHEGQMAAEEEVLQGGALQTLTRSFLGGRGLEAMTTTESGNTTTAYPLYDT
ncbi:MAG: hypothetical protein MH204_09875, partial [Fimbriimonadaceae bacterium]|nr:hypothetical protein [Fimbriimonadaceae bacterium]